MYYVVHILKFTTLYAGLFDLNHDKLNQSKQIMVFNFFEIVFIK